MSLFSIITGVLIVTITVTVDGERSPSLPLTSVLTESAKNCTPIPGWISTFAEFFITVPKTEDTYSSGSTLVMNCHRNCVTINVLRRIKLRCDNGTWKGFEKCVKREYALIF